MINMTAWGSNKDRMMLDVHMRKVLDSKSTAKKTQVKTLIVHPIHHTMTPNCPTMMLSSTKTAHH